ncbi:hypothetical protein [Paraburkholderia terrae]|uniref:hypothetical protein n=1 Tax=Paraburkholderia terrae TaxID=311230 RepID=UPI001EE16A5E|nr:hypothetical protein [Paraburkholderia terrae]GJH03062.1 hypothetical protein CBA19C8_20915 [Paraburkholderia terrae]GJH37090.1 hypothetical protein CBA19CS91_30055 [Paraburkholderia hospita]
MMRIIGKIKGLAADRMRIGRPDRRCPPGFACFGNVYLQIPRLALLARISRLLTGTRRTNGKRPARGRAFRMIGDETGVNRL